MTNHLSSRDIEIFKYYLQGKSLRFCAEKFNLSNNHVCGLIGDMKFKLGILKKNKIDCMTETNRHVHWIKKLENISVGK